MLHHHCASDNEPCLQHFVKYYHGDIIPRTRMLNCGECRMFSELARFKEALENIVDGFITANGYHYQIWVFVLP